MQGLRLDASPCCTSLKEQRMRLTTLAAAIAATMPLITGAAPRPAVAQESPSTSTLSASGAAARRGRHFRQSEDRKAEGNPTLSASGAAARREHHG